MNKWAFAATGGVVLLCGIIVSIDKFRKSIHDFMSASTRISTVEKEISDKKSKDQSSKSDKKENLENDTKDPKDGKEDDKKG